MAFLNLPPIPADASPALREQAERYRVGYFVPEPAVYEPALAVVERLAASPAVSVADLAAKLIVAVHQLAPGDRHASLFTIDRDDFCDDRAATLLLACIDDAIRLAADAPAGTRQRDAASFMASVMTDVRRLEGC